MANCPYYEESTIAGQQSRAIGGPAQRMPDTIAPWCSHIKSPVIERVAIGTIGGHKLLRCKAQLASCQIPNEPK